MSTTEVSFNLGVGAGPVAARLEQWQGEDLGRRIWAKDPTVWGDRNTPDLVDRLGWLTLPIEMRARLPELESFGATLAADEFRHALVLGMGGSSLAPEVFQEILGNREGYPALRVLDSTHPAAVLALARQIDVSRSAFLVSSKSGGTTETMSYFHYFWQRVSSLGDAEKERLGGPGNAFAAVTDPGTSLEKLSRDRGFRWLFSAQSDVGGRYSALTPFGLAPAAAIGADLSGLLTRAEVLAGACGAEVPVAQNPGLALGAALGELAKAGRDKVTFLTSPGLAAFPDWLEQLIAESTGKHGQGIVPVAGEAPGDPAGYGADRFFVGLALAGEESELAKRLAELAAAGHPTASFVLGDRLDLAAEMFRWEFAVAAAGAVLGIQPFDQPDVQLAKDLSSRAMKGELTLDAAGEEVAADSPDLAAVLGRFLDGAAAGDYLGIHAYLAPSPSATATLRVLQAGLRDRTHLATTFGYGPRFLHSTGQLHKGGPAGCRFLQLVDRPGDPLPVPETDFTFAKLIRAQADGDRQALIGRGRTVLRIDLGADAAAGLERLASALGQES